jgi:hypothetical protein
MKATFRRQEPPREDTTELVYLPVAVASAREREAAASKGKRRSSETRLFVVERVLGHGWAVSCDRASMPAVDGTLPTGDGGVDAGGEPPVLPARLSPEECRRSLEALASRATFAFGRGRAADAIELEPLHAARYPFLLRYQRHRSGRIDFDALDAVTGRRAGGPLRAAIAAALVDAHQVRRPCHGRHRGP